MVPQIKVYVHCSVSASEETDPGGNDQSNGHVQKRRRLQIHSERQQSEVPGLYREGAQEQALTVRAS